MNKIERDIYVLRDLSNFDKISYVQGTNAIPIILHIKDYDIPSGSTARVYVKRPDGTIEYDMAEISGNDVTIDVKTSMFSVAGNSILQVKILKGESILVTFGIAVCVKRNHIDDSFKGENGADIFEGMVEDVREYIEGAKEDSANSAAASENHSKLAESWARGDTGVRQGEDTNNSKYFAELADTLTQEAFLLLEQAQRVVAAATSGALIPGGTVAFADLPEDPMVGYMYNISDDFVTDSRFVEGAGIPYKAGVNVYWTAAGKWDVMVGSQVIGVKGSAEEEYQTGLVDISPDDIGLPDILQSKTRLLKGYQLVPANEDMDDYTTTGSYCIYTSALSTIANLPEEITDFTKACIFFVEEGYTDGSIIANPSVRQKFQQFGSTQVFERHVYSNNWSDWALVADDLSKKVDTSKIIQSPNITEVGFLMDGKTVSEELDKKQDVLDKGTNTIPDINSKFVGVTWYNTNKYTGDISDLPFQDYGTIMSFKNGNNDIQLAFPFSSAKGECFLYRMFANGQWYNWRNPNQLKPTPFNLISLSEYTTMNIQKCYKIGNKVCISFTCTSKVAITTSIPLAIIPEEYRPSESLAGLYGIIQISGSINTVSSSAIDIKTVGEYTNGAITQRIGSSIASGNKFILMFEYYLY